MLSRCSFCFFKQWKYHFWHTERNGVKISVQLNSEHRSFYKNITENLSKKASEKIVWSYFCTKEYIVIHGREHGWIFVRGGGERKQIGGSRREVRGRGRRKGEWKDVIILICIILFRCNGLKCLWTRATRKCKCW